MSYLLPIFKAVSLIFGFSAVGTGAQALLSPLSFSRSFGIPIIPSPPPTAQNRLNSNSNSKTTTQHQTESYISLLGIRQLATGIILLTFAYQNKWTEGATVLAIIGVVVAGTDGVYLARTGRRGVAVFHAVPGALISALACGVLWSGVWVG